MKRALFLLLALLICLQPVSAVAADAEMIITIADAEFCSGSTARLEVSISGNTGYSHITAQILYDESCLKLTAVEPVNIHSMFAHNVDTNRVAAAGIDDMKEDGVLFILQFDVLQTGDHTVSLSLESFGNADGKNLTADIQAGTIRAQMHSHQLYTKEPTCTEDGVVGQKCDICGEVDVTERIPALGHTFDREGDAICKVCGADTSKPETDVTPTEPSNPSGGVEPTVEDKPWVTVVLIVLVILVLVLASVVIMLLRRRRMEDNIPLPNFEDLDENLEEEDK